MADSPIPPHTRTPTRPHAHTPKLPSSHSRLLWLTLLLTLPALLSLTAPGYFFDAHDGHHSIFWLVEFDQALRAGALWPVWAPDHAIGFGYPLWLVYAPLAYIVAELFHLLGAGFVVAVKLTWALGFLVGAAGMYRLARRWWGPAAGLIASLAYTYAPYHLVDIYVRAALAEFTALALFPWALLAFVALWDDPRPRRAATASLAFGALLLAHSVALATFVPLLGGFLLWQMAASWVGRRMTADERGTTNDERRTTADERRMTNGGRRSLVVGHWSLVIGHWSLVVGRRSSVWTLIALALGGLLAAIFLLPFLLERRYITEASWLRGTYDFRLHFVYLSQFFNPSWGFGYSVAGPDDGMSFQLGLLQVVGAVVALFANRKSQIANRKLQSEDRSFIRSDSRITDHAPRTTHHAPRTTHHASRITHHASRITHHASRPYQLSNTRFLVPFLVIVTMLCLFAMTPASQPIWERLPLIGSIQFPWRLLGLTTVTLALLCGAAVSTMKPEGSSETLRVCHRRPWVYVAALAFIVASFAYTRPELTPIRRQDESPLAVIEFEMKHPDMRGMTFWSERTPADADSPLLAQYLAGQPLTRGAIVGGQGAILAQSHTAISAQARVRAESQVRLRFYTYYFPGWQATVDGQPVEIAADPPNGLIGLTLPPGEHDVRLRFGATPVRQVGAGLSLLAVGCILVLGFVGRRSERDARAPS